MQGGKVRELADLLGISVVMVHRIWRRGAWTAVLNETFAPQEARHEKEEAGVAIE
jgi:hypothetical protein